jgi:hypothetical protein
MNSIRGRVFLGLLIWAGIAQATAPGSSLYNGALANALIQSAAAGAFNNVVVDIQSIAELPEPRSIVMLGTTLLVICAICRRKFRRQFDDVR